MKFLSLILVYAVCRPLLIIKNKKEGKKAIKLARLAFNFSFLINNFKLEREQGEKWNSREREKNEK